MGKTYKNKKTNYDYGFKQSGVGRKIKLVMKTKRKKYKLDEFPDGNLLNKHLADRWMYD